ncbi:MAG: metal-sensing transcriptional repressor [Bacilli bacterium]|nr:metal-sensing transcriptional repressor [Bacilli bacterium]MBO6286201.1 metal-sensing transcriptional repressor [Bacilli bacterium]
MKANHDKVLRQLKIARGQLDGLVKMVEEDAYCIDISNQLMATTALLKKVNALVLSAHLDHCVKETKGEEEINQKIAEIQSILLRLMD